MVDGVTSGLIRVIRFGVVGIAIAAVCLWVGTHTAGLAGFAATIASLGVVSITLGVAAARAFDILTEKRRPESRVMAWHPNGPHDAARLRESCSICGRHRVRYGATLLCPNCDPRPIRRHIADL
jgi:hypothetical protein